MKTIRIHQREVTENGVIQILISKYSSDGDFLGWHRTAIAPGEDADFIIRSVNAHLESMGFTPLDDISPIKKMVASEHTPEVVKAYRDSQVKNETNPQLA